jgi:L-threonylcarbamoyladenylate synthase
LILIAASQQQLSPYIDDSSLTPAQQARIAASWPGPTSWVFPAAATTPEWLTENFSSIAVRVSDHPVVQQLCRQFGKPLVSTSANLSGQPAISDIGLLHRQLGDKVSHIVPGATNPAQQPSTIIDALSGVVYRN